MLTNFQDQTSEIVRDNLARIKIVGVDASCLQKEHARLRAEQLLDKFALWKLDPPTVVITVHNPPERTAAEVWISSHPELNATIVDQQKRTETFPTLIKAYQQRFAASAANFASKRHILYLASKGGSGRVTFVSAFKGGGGTTCGTWTPVVQRDTERKPVKGFMKVGLVTGFCPVECPFCYLSGLMFLDGMTVHLNWEDLATELHTQWGGYPYPLNFSEIGGFIEYDEWFAAPEGTGSMTQYVIDACAAAQVRPFFLTKIRYPRYLQFKGDVQVGISLMPEEIRKVMAPHGSPSDELLQSLAWSVEHGAKDPVIRLFFLWERRELYQPLLKQCRDLLGPRGWRLTIDLLRFTPKTLCQIAERHPELEKAFQLELDPTGQRSLAKLAKAGRGEKKVRPPVERQADIYRWIREYTTKLGCEAMTICPCKGEPAELASLVREDVLDAMNCACHRDSPLDNLVQLEIKGNASITNLEKPTNVSKHSELSTRVSALLDFPDSQLTKRWKGDVQGLKDPSRSALVMSIARELVCRFVPTGEVEAAIRHWCEINKYEEGLQKGWIESVVDQAYESVARRFRAESIVRIIQKDLRKEA